MITLYDHPDSTNALKVRFLLAELDIEWERVIVDLEGPKPEWYGALHPFGLIPALVDGEVTLTQSNTILRYLADREGRDDLYPRDPARRARVDELLDTLSLEVRPALWEAELRTYYGRDDGVDWRPGLDAALDGWERLLSPGGYATGAFSIADCAAMGRFAHLAELPILLSRWPKLAASLAVVSERPAYRAALVAP